MRSCAHEETGRNQKFQRREIQLWASHQQLKSEVFADSWCETARSPRLPTDCRLVFDGLEKEIFNPS